MPSQDVTSGRAFWARPEFKLCETSVEAPMAAIAAAGGTCAGEFLAAAIGGLGEIAALHARPLIVAGRPEIAAGLAVIPVIAAPDIAIEALGIGVEGIGLVVTVNVLGHRIAEQSAQHRAANDGAAIAAADGGTNRAARGGAEDRARNDIAAPAALLIIALAIIGGGLVVTGAGAPVRAVAPIIAHPHLAIAALAIVIAALVRLAVIAIRVALCLAVAVWFAARAVILGLGGQCCCEQGSRHQ